MQNPHKHWCPGGDLNPHDLLESADFKSAASADFATRALLSSYLKCASMQYSAQLIDPVPGLWKQRRFL